MIIPFMSEQEANGRLFTEAQGAGFVLRKTHPVRKSGQRLEFQFRYSGATANGDVKPEEVRRGLEEIFATPAIADGRLYVRTVSALYCFGGK